MKKLSEGSWGWGKGGVVRWEVIWRFSWPVGVGGRGSGVGGWKAEGKREINGGVCVGKAKSGGVLRKGENGI